MEIKKKFKGKRPLTLCRLTPKGEVALSGYSRRIVRALQANSEYEENSDIGKAQDGSMKTTLGRITRLP